MARRTPRGPQSELVPEAPGDHSGVDSTRRNDAGGPRTRRSRDAQATRRDLLDAARRRFAVLGYENTTVRDIAADAGVNLALINRYFGSKEGLLQAVLSEAADPGFLGDGITDLDTLADELARQYDLVRRLPPAADHLDPVLLFIQSATEPRTAALRRRGLEILLARLVAAAPDVPGRTAAQTRLRAELVLALMIGSAVLRHRNISDGLVAATGDDIRGPLRDVIHALLSAPTV